MRVSLLARAEEVIDMNYPDCIKTKIARTAFDLGRGYERLEVSKTILRGTMLVFIEAVLACFVLFLMSLAGTFGKLPIYLSLLQLAFIVGFYLRSEMIWMQFKHEDD
jgi:hypothetical protein